MTAEQREKTKPLLYVIVGLLVLNLAITGWLASRITQVEAQAVATSELPEALNRDARRHLIDSIIEPYNSGDLQATYDLLHPLARVQLPVDSTKELLSQLRETFGNIQEAVYSHFIYGGYSGGRHSYDLIYKAQFSDGAHGMTNGTMTVNIIYDGDEIGITGFNLGQ